MESRLHTLLGRQILRTAPTVEGHNIHARIDRARWEQLRVRFLEGPSPVRSSSTVEGFDAGRCLMSRARRCVPCADISQTSDWVRFQGARNSSPSRVCRALSGTVLDSRRRSPERCNGQFSLASLSLPSPMVSLSHIVSSPERIKNVSNIFFLFEYFKGRKN